ncbi:Hypothetical protein Rta_08080 [Ramlibacter tataouinensis TTB310]|uniref:Uncharacterized protein n=1 Tax=Ramlibacter tataouinensis (strain ATCC BAA-407 / DSM 14655 / LMG 21543 / TTB310) TaxID=365046 RepID=F5XY96_RAMTT|nr:Hypothetical protein Rta_08080 [Ramlibacter tataouinensis TTB310]
MTRVRLTAVKMPIPSRIKAPIAMYSCGTPTTTAAQTTPAMKTRKPIM